MTTGWIDGAIVLLMLAGVSDLCWRQIPDLLPAALAALFGIAVSTAPSAAIVLSSVATAAAIAAAGLILFVLNVWGGGDAKLMTAAALWAGADRIGELLFVTAIAGGMIGLVTASRQGWRMFRFAPGRWPGGDGRPTVPYGLAIAAAAVAVISDPG